MHQSGSYTQGIHWSVWVQVLQVSRPVEGGVQAPDEQQDEMDLAAIRKVLTSTGAEACVSHIPTPLPWP